MTSSGGPTESSSSVRDRAVARLRANLAAADIPASEAEIDAIVERGFLHTPIAFEAIIAKTPVDLVPDYLGAWDLPGLRQTDDLLEPAKPVTPIDDLPKPSAEASRYSTLIETARRIRLREMTVPYHLDRVLARIKERDPLLNGFQVTFHDEAMAEAYAADQEIGSGNYRGPLHGIPVAVKDLLAMRGTVTTAGSTILAGTTTDYDAAAVERLRAAGAIIVGKTRMSEFAFSPGSNNGHYGPTHNPWNLDHDTGGSSSGSAAVVADGLVAAALGSDTGGSIRMPAALCGIVGLKPTFGLVSLYGGVMLCWSLDHLGPMTRSVADAAVMLNVLAGYDPRDPRTRPIQVPDYTAGLDAGVAGLRVGVITDAGSGDGLGDPDAVAAWKSGLDALARNGAELVEIPLPQLEDLRILNSAIIAREAIAFHEPMMREHLSDYADYSRPRFLSLFGYPLQALVRAEQARIAIRQELNELWDQIDLLSTPTMRYGAPPLGDPSRNTYYTSPFNCLGWPAITVPVGLTDDRLPLGLQLIGKPWHDATVLRAALVVESDGPWPGGTP